MLWQLFYLQHDSSEGLFVWTSSLCVTGTDRWVNSVKTLSRALSLGSPRSCHYHHGVYLSSSVSLLSLWTEWVTFASIKYEERRQYEQRTPPPFFFFFFKRVCFWKFFLCCFCLTLFFVFVLFFNFSVWCHGKTELCHWALFVLSKVTVMLPIPKEASPVSTS